MLLAQSPKKMLQRRTLHRPQGVMLDLHSALPLHHRGQHLIACASSWFVAAGLVGHADAPAACICGTSNAHSFSLQLEHQQSLFPSEFRVPVLRCACRHGSVTESC
jgi:hypothetical protein